MELISTAFRSGDDGIFVRYRDGLVGYARFERLGLVNFAEDLRPAEARILYRGAVLSIPTHSGSEIDIDNEALRSLFDEKHRSRLNKLELESARKVGEQIRTMRKQMGWNQVELGRRSGLDQAVISKLERGIHYPRMETLEKIAESFSLSLGEVLAGPD